ncbi:MAG: PAS domain S-box protein [Bacillota bacterium]
MIEKVKLLIIEDSEEYAQLILREIEKSGIYADAKIVSTFSRVKHELQNSKWDCILCEDDSSEFKSLDVFELLKEAEMDIPFIIISGEFSDELAISAMKSGVRDYVKKSNLKRLGPVMHRELKDAKVRSERNNYSNELMQEKERLAITLGSIGDGVITTDTEGNITLINDKACFLTGWTQEMALGMPLHKVFNIFDKYNNKEAESIIERIIKENGSVGLRNHTVLKSNSGIERYISASGAPIRNSSGIFTGAVVVFRDITSLKFAEEKIVNEQKNFKAVFYEAPIGMVVLDENGVIKNANLTFIKMIGGQIPNYLGNRIGATLGCLYSYNDYGGCGFSVDCKACRLRNIVEYVWKNERPVYGLEVLHVKLVEGREKSVWYRISSQPLILDGSRFVLVAMDDITTQKQLSLDLQKSEENLRQITDNILEMLTKCDVTGNIEYLSPSVKNLLGYEPAELIGKSIFDLLYSEDYEYMKNTFIHQIKEGTSGSAEFRYNTKNGSYIWMDVSGNLLYNDKGEITGALLVGRDITENKKMESAVQESERRYKALFENSSDIIFTYDITGKIQSINKAGERLLGYSSEELFQLTINDILVPESSKPDYNSESEIDNIRNEKETVDINVYNKAGERVILEVNRQLIYENDKPVGIQGIARDITQRKFIEAELQRAKDEAEAANLAKSEFLANMSHEIRTPMNGITGMLDLMNLTELDNEQQEYLDIIKSCVDSLLKVLNDILDFSKIEAGKLVIESINFNFTDLMDKMYKTYVVKAQEKGLALSCHIDPDIPENLIGDPLRLRQVLNNLIGNAIKFTDYGEVNIKVEKIEAIGEQLQLKFSIRDTGIGIAEEEMVKLFKSFSQIDGSFTRKYSGTGLGLVISKRLVEMMGGAIWVESEKGTGSTFYFVVFFGTGDVNKLKLSKPEIQKKHDSIHGILLVEDNRMNQIASSSMLEKKGYSIDIACNGIEALRKLEEKKYDVILMDIQMPEMDGIETTRIIREKEKHTGEHIPIIALTAYALQGDGEKFISQGMDYYVAKPVKMEDLFTALSHAAKLIDKKSSEEAVQIINFNTEEVHEDKSIIQHSMDVSQMKEVINKLDKALEASNFVIIEQCAHRIKELSKHLYMNKLKSTAFKMELAARKQNMPEIEAIFKQLKDETKLLE